MSQLQALIDQKNELERLIAQRHADERHAAITQIQALMDTHRINVADLVIAKIGRVPQLLPPKYRNPATGDTWSGRGKRPRWVHDALEAGRHLHDFAAWG